MSLRFFLDQCVPYSVMEPLQNAGYEVELVKDHIPIDSPDPIVIAQAQALDAILLTLNGDFADIINYPPANYRGIIALQLKNSPKALPAIMMRLLSYLNEHSESEHYHGKLFLIEPHRIRIRE